MNKNGPKMGQKYEGVKGEFRKGIDGTKSKSGGEFTCESHGRCEPRTGCVGKQEGGSGSHVWGNLSGSGEN